MEGVLKVIGVAIIASIMIYGITRYAIDLKTKLNHKKEMLELEKEKLRLEIKLLKLKNKHS